MRYLLVLIAVLAGLLSWAVRGGHVGLEWPSPWNPWALLDVAAPPNWLTGYKLSRLDGDPLACRAVLAGAGLNHTPVPDNDVGDGCGWRDAVRVTDPRFAPAFTLGCSAAVSLAMWERHALQPAAQQHLGQAVVRVEHLGSYACRNVRGTRGEGARRSQHATANAWDVAGFRLADGQRIRVQSSWQGEGREAAFLRSARDGACRFFKGTLSPDYNEAHRDHFHLDRGGYRMCR